ncbi:hypothetical protein [Amorphus sp. 3PC139-8]|uniref:hypothetical protein n=1 Tax=Amorphus sp. 3PC139-8 TaxID=2735676 RepID=UPI00345DBC66
MTGFLAAVCKTSAKTTIGFVSQASALPDSERSYIGMIQKTASMGFALTSRDQASTAVSTHRNHGLRLLIAAFFELNYLQTS